MSVSFDLLVKRHKTSLEIIKSQEWMPRNNTRIPWQKVEAEFARMLELMGETAVLQALAAVEFQKSSWAPSDVWQVLKEQQAVKDADPQTYEDMRRNAVDPSQGWVARYRTEAMVPYLSGRIDMTEYERRCKEIVPKEAQG
jgi:hypothetical protein